MNDSTPGHGCPEAAYQTSRPPFLIHSIQDKVLVNTQEIVRLRAAGPARGSSPNWRTGQEYPPIRLTSGGKQLGTACLGTPMGYIEDWLIDGVGEAEDM